MVLIFIIYFHSNHLWLAGGLLPQKYIDYLHKSNKAYAGGELTEARRAFQASWMRTAWPLIASYLQVVDSNVEKTVGY